MAKHYRIEKTQNNRTKKLAFAGTGLALLFAVAVGIYVFFDLNNNQLAVDDSNNRATLGVVESIKEDQQLVETDLYSMEIPADWRRVTNPEVSVNNVIYYPERYQGTSGKHVGRRIDVYIDSIPAGLGINKVVAIKPAGRRIIVDEISSQCYYFTDVPEGKSGNTFPSVWQEKGIDFSCNSSVLSNIVGAIHKSEADGVELDTSENGKKNIFLVYTDHGSFTDNSIFFDILESFETK